MPFDGVTVAAVVAEFRDKFTGGKIDKIYEPERGEIVLSVRKAGGGGKLLLSSGAGAPRAHITFSQKENPATPPMFCMVLRKHISGGKIVSFEQPSFERIIRINISAFNEMGDNVEKTLVIEIMGKHSNVILLDTDGAIIDSAKRVPADVSSVREVLPGKVYIFPPDKGKKNPLKTTESEFFSFFSQTEKRVQNFLYENYSGISPLMASDICIRAGINPSDSVSEIEKEKLFFSFKETISKINENQFVYTVFLDKNKTPNDFSCFNLSVFPPEYEKAFFDSPSEMLEFFYKERDLRYYALQKSHDLRRLISVNIERIVKKLDLLQKTLSDTENRNTFRLYGELITANFYAVKKGDKVLKAIDFTKDTAPEVKIPLDPNLTPNENAQKYFKKYNKQKRTREAVVEQISQAKEELEYLESAANAAETAADEADVAEIREELATQGFIKKVSKKGKKERAKKSKPLKFTSADGFDIYVGKSNTQNDELTIKFAVQDDIWLHTQKIPGSHVIIKTEGKEAPLKTIEQAAQLAAYFSKARQAGVVPVDYTTRKNVKKPNGSRPGMVIYDNYKTAFVTPELI